MSLKPGDELDKDQENDAQKATVVVDSDDEEVGNVNINNECCSTKHKFRKSF